MQKIKAFEEAMLEDWVKFNASCVLMKEGIDFAKEVLKDEFKNKIYSIDSRVMSHYVTNMVIKYVVVNRVCKQFYGDVIVTGDTAANILLPTLTASDDNLEFIVKPEAVNSGFKQCLQEACQKLVDNYLIDSYEVFECDYAHVTTLNLGDSRSLKIYCWLPEFPTINYACNNEVLHCVPVDCPENVLCKIMRNLILSNDSNVPYHYTNILAIYDNIKLSKEVLKVAKYNYLSNKQLSEDIENRKRQITKAYVSYSREQTNRHILSSKVTDSILLTGDVTVFRILNWLLIEDFDSLIDSQKSDHLIDLNKRTNMFIRRPILNNE